MYLKLVPSSHTNSGYANQIGVIHYTIKSVLDGTYTSTSDLNTSYFDVANCELSGTAPTAGTYHTFTAQDSTFPVTEVGTNYNIEFIKKYADQDVGSGFTPEYKIRTYWTGSGPAWSTQKVSGTWNSTGSTDNDFPYWAGNGSGSMSPSTPSSTSSAMHSTYTTSSRGWQYLESIHMIATDDTFMIHYAYAGSSIDNTTHLATTRDRTGGFTFIVNDLDIVEGMDQAFYDQNSDYSPTVTTQMGVSSRLWNDVLPVLYTGNYDNWWITGKNQYPNSFGQFKISYSSTSDANFYNNNLATMRSWLNSANPFHAWHPAPMTGVPKYVGNNLQSAFQLIPLAYIPQGSNRQAIAQDDSDVRYGNFKNFYRTADNLISTQGQQATIGGTSYRLFRFHKTGAPYNQSHPYCNTSAVYALPE